jgi:hypothetical protein
MIASEIYVTEIINVTKTERQKIHKNTKMKFLRALKVYIRMNALKIKKGKVSTCTISKFVHVLN